MIILNISYPVFWIGHNIFPDILNKEEYGISLTLTQNAYLYTPVFSYALYTPAFGCIRPAYKRFYSPYSAMFYAVNVLFLSENINFGNLLVPTIPFKHQKNVVANKSLSKSKWITLVAAQVIKAMWFVSVLITVLAYTGLLQSVSLH